MNNQLIMEISEKYNIVLDSELNVYNVTIGNTIYLLSFNYDGTNLYTIHSVSVDGDDYTVHYESVNCFDVHQFIDVVNLHQFNLLAISLGSVINENSDYHIHIKENSFIIFLYSKGRYYLMLHDIDCSLCPTILDSSVMPTFEFIKYIIHSLK